MDGKRYIKYMIFSYLKLFITIELILLSFVILSLKNMYTTCSVNIHMLHAGH